MKKKTLNISQEVVKLQPILLNPLLYSKEEVMKAKKFLSQAEASMYLNDEATLLVKLTYPGLIKYVHEKNSRNQIGIEQYEKLVPKIAQEVNKINDPIEKHRKLFLWIAGLRGDESKFQISWRLFWLLFSTIATLTSAVVLSRLIAMKEVLGAFHIDFEPYFLNNFIQTISDSFGETGVPLSQVDLPKPSNFDLDKGITPMDASTLDRINNSIPMNTEPLEESLRNQVLEPTGPKFESDLDKIQRGDQETLDRIIDEIKSKQQEHVHIIKTIIKNESWSYSDYLLTVAYYGGLALLTVGVIAGGYYICVNANEGLRQSFETIKNTVSG